jgi:hypothetical protein
MDSSSVTTWLYGAAAGDSLSAQKLWERYLDRLVGLAADRLRNSPKRLADEEDLALRVFDEFLRKARQGIYPRLASREDFWQIVVQIAERRLHQIRQAWADLMPADGAAQPGTPGPHPWRSTDESQS